MDPITVAVWPYMLTLAVVLILVSYIRQRMRDASLESTAKKMGFEFSASGRSTTLPGHEKFDLFHRGSNRRVSNKLWKTVNGSDFSLFVFAYREVGGNENNRHKTVLSVKSPRLDAPVLCLKPKLKRLMMVPDLGQYDSGFETSSALSKSYVLNGNDEVKVREFFNACAVKYFEANPDFYLEMRGDTFVFYNSSRKSDSRDVEKLYAQGREILSIFIS